MKLYDAMLYKNKPNLGLPIVNMVYNVGMGGKTGDRFWPISNFNGQLPDEAIVRHVACEEAVKPGEYTIIDIEGWPLNTPDQITANLPKLIQIVRWMRAEVPSLKLGYFGLVPQYTEQIAYFPVGTDFYTKWQATNDLLQPLADVVDALFPACYTFHPLGYQAQWPSQWGDYTRAMVSECRRLAPTKPCLPFVWMQYADGSTPGSLAYQFIDGNYAAMQLGILRTFADGGVIWGPGSEFTPGDWWEVVRRV